MSTTKAQQAATARYHAANYDRIGLLIPKGQRDQIRAAADAAGLSLNAYCVQAINRRMTAEGFEMEAAPVFSADPAADPMPDD